MYTPSVHCTSLSGRIKHIRGRPRKNTLGAVRDRFVSFCFYYHCIILLLLLVLLLLLLLWLLWLLLLYYTLGYLIGRTEIVDDTSGARAYIKVPSVM